MTKVPLGISAYIIGAVQNSTPFIASFNTPRDYKKLRVCLEKGIRWYRQNQMKMKLKPMVNGTNYTDIQLTGRPRLYLMDFGTIEHILLKCTRGTMVSSKGNSFRVTDPFVWIPFTKGSDAVLWNFIWSALDKLLSNNRESDYLRYHCAHDGVPVMASAHRNLAYLHLGEKVSNWELYESDVNLVNVWVMILLAWYLRSPSFGNWL